MKRGTSNTLTMDMGGIRTAKWDEKPHFGSSEGYAVSTSRTFRTVSKGILSEIAASRSSRESLAGILVGSKMV